MTDTKTSQRRQRQHYQMMTIIMLKAIIWPRRFKLIGMRFSPGRIHFATTVDNIDLTYQNRKLPSNKLSRTPNNATPLPANLHPATDLEEQEEENDNDDDDKEEEKNITKHGRDSLTSRKIVLLSFSFRCFQAPELINSPSIVAIYLQNRRLARAWRPTD
ncbi:hypothetical protein T02_12570 [Trichinella nativa]|uniref:Uncharacterized protein n=1 Tax=Trichinella nativa TaxID=6335 RepID=A0A0V1KX04_9BILA|nr:hypothetical protein T06_3674 [Trichinella sp. T6]KRZ51342.1 hypothetical protein T02_12570 [Trichinella nativa]